MHQEDVDRIGWASGLSEGVGDNLPYTPNDCMHFTVHTFPWELFSLFSESSDVFSLFIFIQCLGSMIHMSCCVFYMDIVSECIQKVSNTLFNRILLARTAYLIAFIAMHSQSAIQAWKPAPHSLLSWSAAAICFSIVSSAIEQRTISWTWATCFTTWTFTNSRAICKNT